MLVLSLSKEWPIEGLARQLVYVTYVLAHCLVFN